MVIINLYKIKCLFHIITYQINIFNKEYQLDNTHKLSLDIERILTEKESHNIPDDAIIMSIEEILHFNTSFKPDTINNQTLSFSSMDLLTFMKYFSHEEDSVELTNELIKLHNSSFNIFIDTIDGELYSLNVFFEFSPYDASQITIIGDTIERVE